MNNLSLFKASTIEQIYLIKDKSNLKLDVENIIFCSTDRLDDFTFFLDNKVIEGRHYKKAIYKNKNYLLYRSGNYMKLIDVCLLKNLDEYYIDFNNVHEFIATEAIINNKSYLFSKNEFVIRYDQSKIRLLLKESILEVVSISRLLANNETSIRSKNDYNKLPRKYHEDILEILDITENWKYKKEQYERKCI